MTENEPLSEQRPRLGRLLYDRFRVEASMTRLGDEDGQTLAEYVLILAFIALVVVGAVGLFAPTLHAMFSSVGNAI